MTSKKGNKILTFKRAAAFLMSMCLLLGSSDFGLTLSAAENVRAVFSEKLSENRTSSEITMSVSASDQNTQILQIENPDGSVSGDITTTTYSVAENGTYGFTVTYQIDGREESKETFSYIVSGIGKTDGETGSEEEPSGNTGTDTGNGTTDEAGDGENTEGTDGTAVTGPLRAPRAAGDIAITAENFPDDNFRQYVADNLDTDSNSSLSDEEIAAVTEINVANQGISDLKGIEYFTELTRLDCYLNNLTALDVSQNTALRRLYCHSNQLVQLELGQNSSLASLSCYSNNLTTLDVSGNPSLTSLQCESNNLTTLDVSANPLLSSLHCHSNDLSELRLGSNTALTTLNCSTNNLHTLDISGATALRSLICSSNELETLRLDQNTSLDTLLCNSNNLTELDVSGNPSLTVLRCNSNLLDELNISRNTALETLNCGSNNLSALDLSRNTELTTLHCDSNNLTSLNIRQNTALTELNCDSNHLSQLDVSQNISLRSLSCNRNNLAYLTYGSNLFLIMFGQINANMQTLELPVTYDDATGNWRTQAGIFNGNVTFGAAGVSLSSDGTYAVVEGTVAESAFTWTIPSSQKTLGGTVTFVYPKGIPITEEYFPDDIFRNYLISQTYGQDKFLTDEEINEITALDVSFETLNQALDTTGETISDLTGIEYFTQLTSLDCGGNMLTNLDVGQNTNLTYLDCSVNEIAELRLGAQNFEYIDCSVNNLTYITGDPANFSDTGTYIGSGQTPEVTVAYYRNTSEGEIWKSMDYAFAETVTFSEADVTFIQEGNCVTVPEDVTATDFEWTMPEASLPGASDSLLSGTVTFVRAEGLLINEENFPDDNFRAYLLEQDYGTDGILTDAEIERITEMDCSGREIADLTGISHFTSLTDLDCSGNRLTALTIPESLVTVDCSWNQLSELSVRRADETTTNLTYLDCSYNNLIKIDAYKTNELDVGTVIGHDQEVVVDIRFYATENSWRSGPEITGPHTEIAVNGSGTATADPEGNWIRTSGPEAREGNFTVYVCGEDARDNSLSGNISFTYQYARNGYIAVEEALTVTGPEDLLKFGLFGGLTETEQETLQISVDDLAGLQAGTRKAYNVTYSWTNDSGMPVQETAEITVVPEGSAFTDSRNSYISLPTDIELGIGSRMEWNVSWIVVNIQAANAAGKGQYACGSYEPRYELMVDPLGAIGGHNEWIITGDTYYPAYGEYSLHYTVPLLRGEKIELTQKIHVMPDEPTDLVIIPSTIELEQVEGSRTVEASKTSEVSLVSDAQGDHMPDVNITADSEFQITNEDQESLDCEIYINGVRYDASSGPLAVLNKNKDVVSQQFEIRALKSDAGYIGQFTGTLNFTVSYEE